MYALVLAMILLLGLTSVAFNMTQSTTTDQRDLAKFNATQVGKGLLDLARGLESYHTVNGHDMPSLGWQTTLTPTYAFRPPSIRGGYWHYARSGDNDYFCIFLPSNLNAKEYAALRREMTAISTPEHPAFLSTSGCQPSFSAPTAYPTIAYASIWINRLDIPPP
jgi:hypothetical protein